jgi:hypothetical protein
LAITAALASGSHRSSVAFGLSFATYRIYLVRDLGSC